jgi:uncharacterized protein
VIRRYFQAAPSPEELFDMDGVDAVVRDTDDPELVIAQIEHDGRSLVTGESYRFHALGVVRVRSGLIVHYRDYMDPLAAERLLGRMPALVAALTSV